MDPKILAFLDACLAVLRGERTDGVDQSSPRFEAAVSEPEAEQYFNERAEQILGDPLKVEFPKDLFRASDTKAGEADPLAAIKQELEAAGHDLDYEFDLEVYLPCMIEYLTARHNLERRPLESEAAAILGRPDPHEGTNEPPAEPVLKGALPGATKPEAKAKADEPTNTEHPAAPSLVGQLPGAANPKQQTLGQGTGTKPEAKAVPKGTPTVKSVRSRLTPKRSPAPSKGELRAHQAWQRQWVLGLTEYTKGKNAQLKERIRELRFQELEPGLDPFVRNRLIADLSGILTDNIDPELLNEESTP